MSLVDDLIARLSSCPPGLAGWQDFEDVCIDILRYSFVPPLSEPHIQSRTYSGIDRRDAIFPNRAPETRNWKLLLEELSARLILCEFKNYGSSEIGKDEVDQARNYLKKTMGRLALLICNKPPNEAAHIRRNSVFSEESKVILFLTPEDLIELMYIKERGEDPSDLIVDLVEQFYLQHE
ncbi:MAG TPA: hypothetical protein VF826_02685 [Chloroflexia bacterium]|jgi:hypothetical protein